MLIRGRLMYLIAAVITMAAGLASRHFGGMLPVFLHEHAGDALWAGMVYFGIRMIWISRSRVWAIMFGVIFSSAIEFSQMIQTPWLNELRSTMFGALILGRGFLVVDLIRYTVGIMCMFVIDHYFLSNRRS
ncbi:DUF2809 domain-containing protein [Paenibacillus sp. MABNR03]|uniref:ribosomal maturation YjgA family protein n=1 Tax=Paenibacillus sp. MABNR03 TaxID=3142626 RepID=UPI003D281213